MGEYSPPEVMVALGDEVAGQWGDEQAPLDNPSIPDAEAIAQVQRMVTPKIRTVGVPARQRDIWGGFAATPEGVQLIRKGEAVLLDPLPELGRELWLLYETSGDRSQYEEAFTSRMNRLVDLALAECLEYEGRFLPAIEANILSVLEQGAWSVPAHGKGIAVYEGTQIVVDLAAAQLAWSLATIDYWLADQLSPSVRMQIKTEMRRRVFEPYRQAIYNQEPMWWMVRPNNWMAVCAGAITGAALTIEPDPAVRAEFIVIAKDLLGRYIDSYNSDGISEEGISYWSYGFSHYLYASEAIRRTTGGSIDLLADPKVLRVSQSPRSLRIQGNAYGAFGDQSIYAGADLSISNFAAMRYGLETMDPADFGRISRGRRHPLSPQVYSHILFAFGNDVAPVEGISMADIGAESLRYRSWFPDSGLYLCRPGNENPNGLGLAFRLGHNGEFHNHNDIGSFVVTRAGRPILIDPGMERYTKDSFSSKRYEISLNNSFGHPVPLVGNRMQKTGSQAQGRMLTADASPEVDVLVADLTQAYRSPGLIQLTRRIEYLRPSALSDSRIVIRDKVAYEAPEDFSTALITLGEIIIHEGGLIEFKDDETTLFAQIETGGVPFALQQVPVTGFTTPASRGIQRMGIYLTQPVKEGYIQVTVTDHIPTSVR